MCACVCARVSMLPVNFLLPTFERTKSACAYAACQLFVAYF